jgi:very-short-patch-repair endonuclease
MGLDWNGVTRQNVIDAIRLFDESVDNYPPAKNTFLEYEGHTYPAKHIRALSYKTSFGQEAPKSEFSGGAETVSFFEKRGFVVKYMSKPVKKDDPSNTLSHNKHIEKQKPANPPIVNVQKPEQAMPDKTDTVRISGKKVTEQKNALQLALNRYFKGDVVCEKTFEWMITPNDSRENIFLVDALKRYRGRAGFDKGGYKLRCDFVCESQKLIFEYDERQHFSLARKAALECYPSYLTLYFNKQKWISACDSIQAKDNDPQNRDEIRAYYDSIRDIQSAKNGYRLIRIMHGQYDWESNQAQQYIDELLNYKPFEGVVSKNKLSPKSRGADMHLDDKPVTVVTATLQSNNRNINDNTKMELLTKVVSEYRDKDIILFPAGFFTHADYDDNLIKKTVDKVSEVLKTQSSDTVICLGIDCNYSKDQLAYAITQTGILAAARKFHPTGEERNNINTADSFNSTEMGYERIFERRGKNFYLAVCYDVFGIRHQDLTNPGVDAILDLAHRFHPRGKGPSGDVDFARKGFAGASAQWMCPVFGTAVFFNRPIPSSWPTGVLWMGEGKSLKNFKYTDNQLYPVSKSILTGKNEDVICYQYDL